MKRLQVNTTQNVKIDFELANIGHRMLAFFVDNIIKFAYVYLVIRYFNFGAFNNVVGDSWSIKALDILMFLPITFYSLYSEILLNGQTIGKKLAKIKVINVDGFKPSFIDFTMRWFMRIVDFNFFILVFIYAYSLGLDKYLVLLWLIFFGGKLVGFFSVLTSKNNQRVGDLSANTVVIHLKDEASFSHTIIEELTEEYTPKYVNVIKLSDNDARIIKDTFYSARKSKDYKTLIKLRTKIEEVTGIKSKEDSDIQFIDRVLKDYNFYTQNM
ncbi:Uncharacterized membrane protein YckC, RDD family [Tenacibaculum sp. MAR_2009_124]|uniref:RDD family protein n=1 Tax=Tenacibaculum sp. MAR_2009_124 TaxID=1250059 RepID=UPI000895620B|nr:RDD family protein [Tenacibaculum sp. MAR_2009_124]SEB42251.1 Uncharacterized membrane protein YckC, RDD family [Tenacibaculum sp. MAR_2009_124]